MPSHEAWPVYVVPLFEPLQARPRPPQVGGPSVP